MVPLRRLATLTRDALAKPASTALVDQALLLTIIALIAASCLAPVGERLKAEFDQVTRAL